MHTLFVYGTLRHPPLLDGLVGTPVAARPATLPGHRAATMRERVYPGLVVAPDAVAEGSLVVVDDAGLAVLDQFEGPEYTRTRVDVTSAAGIVEADTYLLTGPSRSLVEPTTWSLDTFVAREAARWIRGATPGTHHPTS